jgi:pimeloyl-ACP methyl ester carboxylesterase
MPSVLVAHGALGSAAQMQPIASALGALRDPQSGEPITVEVVEFPGHGSTALTDGTRFLLTDFVDVLAAAVSRCASPPLLFGYSMGGYVGLALEARAPLTFTAIVTLGTKFEWTVQTAEHEAARLDPVVIASKVPRFAATLTARHAGPGGWETMMVRTATLLRANGRAPLLSLDVLERITIPVTVAVGADDETVTVMEAESAAGVMLRGRCVVLDGVAHPIERVPVERVVELVRNTLGERSNH